MYFLFSGEGATDLGRCIHPVEFCEGKEYEHGPMTVMVDQIVFTQRNYSPLETSGYYGFLPESTLKGRASDLKAVKKAPKLSGRKRPKETLYFYNNARVLARIALEREQELEDDVVAVLFHDSDGTASAGRGLWADKFQSMLTGFRVEGFDRGVPMIPKPKSEAWILCAMKYGYQNCDALEGRSGNDDSPKALKDELEEHNGEKLSAADLVALIENRTIDIDQLSMPSFNAFRTRLEKVIDK